MFPEKWLRFVHDVDRERYDSFGLGLGLTARRYMLVNKYGG